MQRLSQLTIGVSIACAIASIAYAQGTPIQPTPLNYSIDAMPTGTHVNVPAGANLQQYLDASHPGDELILPAGATYTGSFLLPVRCGANPAWTIIRSDSTTLPASGTRIDPSVDAAKMPKIIVSASTAPNPALGTKPYDTAQGCFAQKYWIMGVEITPDPSLTSFNGDVVEFGDPNEMDASRIATNIYLDRSYVHGLSTLNGKPTSHGIRLDGKQLAVFSSYVSDFASLLSSGKQAQAIYSITGVGPMQITNNYIEGSSENVIFGGDDPATCYGASGSAGCTVPSDITFTKNTVKKPLYWKFNDPSHPSGQQEYCSATLFELKNARRVLIDGNDFEYQWWSTCDTVLSGQAITFTVRNQDGGDPAATVQDVTFTNNYVRHVVGGISILGRDNNHPSQGEVRILIQNNLFEDLSTSWADGTNPNAPGRTIFITLSANRPEYGSDVNYPDSLTIDHNTFINNDLNDNSYVMISCDDCYQPNNCTSSGFNPRATHFTFTNNIVGEVQYGFDGQCTSPEGRDATNSTFSKYFDATLAFTGNTIVGLNGQTGQSPATWYDGAPGVVGTVANDRFVATWNDVGFTNFAAGDYHVPSGSAGANVDTIDLHQPGGPGGGGCTSVPSADVGATGVSGSSCITGNVWTVKGSGTDIWGSNDAFQFAYQQLAGDGTIVARVTSVQNTSSFAKAGIMIRQSLDANSPHVILDLRPTNDVEFMTRPSTGAATTYLAGAVQAPPTWLKLERAGSTIAASVSSDGSNWTSVGTTTLTIASTAYVGLVVSSHDNAQLNTSTFDNVSISSPGFTHQDVGAVGVTGNSTLSGSTWTVKGAGADIWGTADAFQFNYQQLTGDGTLIARVAAIQNTNTFAKAGIMIRESLNANAAHVILDVRPTNDVEFMTRPSTGAQTSYIAGAIQAPPTWLKLQRAGSTITASVSANGTSWTTVGTATLNIAAQAYWGLAVTSRDTTQLNTSTFDNVSIMPAGGLPHFDVPFSVPGTFQAEDFNDGGEGVAYHDNVAGNAGGQYRTSEDVDIITATGNGTGYVVNNFETGEWLNYTISASSTRSYNVSLNVSSEFTGTTFHIEVDGVNVSGSVTVPNTGSWSTFQPVTVTGVNLTAGTHVLKVVADLQYFNFDSVQIQ